MRGIVGRTRAGGESSNPGLSKYAAHVARVGLTSQCWRVPCVTWLHSEHPSTRTLGQSDTLLRVELCGGVEFVVLILTPGYEDATVGEERRGVHE